MLPRHLARSVRYGSNWLTWLSSFAWLMLPGSATAGAPIPTRVRDAWGDVCSREILIPKTSRRFMARHAEISHPAAVRTLP